MQNARSCSLPVLSRFFMLWLMVIAFPVSAQMPPIHPQVQALLDQSESPEGVVFEIETLNANALSKLSDYVRRQIGHIREVYPEVDIAVVSHGTELFALQNQAVRNSGQNRTLHQNFERLVGEEAVSLHVCGAVAGLDRLTREDFPAFVSYSASGIAQINDYKALGYAVVVIRQLTEKQRKALFETPEDYLR